MKTITINVPDDCEVQIVRKEERKKNRFKKGDVIVFYSGHIGIFEELKHDPNSDVKLLYYSTLYSTSNGFHSINKIDYFCIGTEHNCRLATEKEKAILIIALKEISKESQDAVKVLKNVFNIKYIPKIKTY